MITEIEDYFSKGCGRCDRFATPACSTRKWSDGLGLLRAICLEAGLQETVKWGCPCYIYAGRNIAVIGAFRSDFRISFFNAALMQDPEHALEKQGPNTRHPDMLRFTSAASVEARAVMLLAYLREAMRYAEAGVRPPRLDEDVDLPDELMDALDADPVLADAFAALTPGRRRSYAIVLGSAKTSATRTARIEKLRPRILSGKGANEY